MEIVESESEALDCIAANRPCVIRAPAILQAFIDAKWLTVDGTIDFDQLLGTEQIANSTVDVVECDTCKSSPMPFSAFVEQLRRADGRQKKLYVRDWHLFELLHNDKRTKAILDAIPKCFTADDWLNTFWNGVDRADYKFVYIGGNESHTLVHADVFRSYSWSANIVGTKQWYLYPPSAIEYLKSADGRHMLQDIRNVDHAVYPDYPTKALPQQIQYTQQPGDVLFVPSNWFHQVHNSVSAILLRLHYV